MGRQAKWFIVKLLFNNAIVYSGESRRAANQLFDDLHNAGWNVSFEIIYDTPSERSRLEQLMKGR